MGVERREGEKSGEREGEGVFVSGIPVAAAETVTERLCELVGEDAAEETTGVKVMLTLIEGEAVMVTLLLLQEEALLLMQEEALREALVQCDIDALPLAVIEELLLGAPEPVTLESVELLTLLHAVTV